MAAIHQWKQFFQACLSKRLRAARMGKLAEQIRGRYPLPGQVIVEILLEPSAERFTLAGIDPLLHVYVDKLLSLGLVDVSDVLLALYRSSRDFRLQQQQAQHQKEEDALLSQNPDDNDTAETKKSLELASAPTNHPELEDTILHTSPPGTALHQWR
jgi:hypothetical protein